MPYDSQEQAKGIEILSSKGFSQSDAFRCVKILEQEILILESLQQFEDQKARNEVITALVCAIIKSCVKEDHYDAYLELAKEKLKKVK